MARKPNKSQTRIDLEEKYRQLAKRADQRLVRLERLSMEKGFEKTLQYAYRVAMRDIRSWSGSDARRFNTRPPKNTAQLKAKIADIEKFLESVTSTKTGIVTSYDNRVNKFNEKYGTNFTGAELSEFFKTTLYQKMDSKVEVSDTVMRAIAVITQNEDYIRKQIEEHKPIHIDVDDMHVKSTVDRFVRYYKKDITKFFDAF